MACSKRTNEMIKVSIKIDSCSVFRNSSIKLIYDMTSHKPVFFLSDANILLKHEYYLVYLFFFLKFPSAQVRLCLMLRGVDQYPNCLICCRKIPCYRLLE